MPQPSIERQAASIVVLGSFNPSIFSPGWLVSENLLAREDIEDQEVGVIARNIARFRCAWLFCEVTFQKLRMVTTDPQEFSRLRDVVEGALRVLNHTPVAGVGLNREVHYQYSSSNEWHRLGDRLMPKEPWEGVLELPGMQNLQARGVRLDEYRGYVNIVIEPSTEVVPHGLRIEHNDHYILEKASQQPTSREDYADSDAVTPVEATSQRVTTLLEILTNNWDTSLTNGENAAAAIVRST